MKKLILVVTALLFATAAFAQNTKLPINEKTQKICFQKVVKTQGTPNQVHDRIISAFLNTYYKSAASVVFGDDGTKIQGKHTVQMSCNDEIKTKCPWVNYKFTIEIREGRIRYSLTDFTLKTSQSLFPIERWMDKSDPMYEPQWDSYIDQLASFGQKWGSELEEKLIPEKEIKEEDW
ncbi:MAG: hypothetical protein ACTTKO_00295 [Candidatus Limimorpha sp.]